MNPEKPFAMEATELNTKIELHWYIRILKTNSKWLRHFICSLFDFVYRLDSDGYRYTSKDGIRFKTKEKLHEFESLKNGKDKHANTINSNI